LNHCLKIGFQALPEILSVLHAFDSIIEFHKGFINNGYIMLPIINYPFESQIRVKAKHPKWQIEYDLNSTYNLI